MNAIWKKGHLLVSESRGETRHLLKKIKAYEKIGVDASWLDQSDAEARFAGTGIKAGLFYPEDRILNPGKLLKGLKQATESIGVEVFEYSPCIEIQPMMRLWPIHSWEALQHQGWYWQRMPIPIPSIF